MSFWKRKNELEEAEAAQEAKNTESNKVSKPSTETAKPVNSGGPVTAKEASSPPQQQSTPSSADEPVTAELSVEEHINQRYGKVRSALGAGTVIQGKLSFDTPVRIDGKLSGEIFSSKALIVGPTGQIDARVEAASLVILGSVKGDVKATERIELLRGGQLEGHISTPIFTIENSARFNGTCEMASRSKVVPVNAGDTSKTNIITAPNVDLEEVIASSGASSSSTENKTGAANVGSSASEIPAS